MIATNDTQIEILREGGRRLARHVRILCEMLHPGMSAKELEAHAAEMVDKDGDVMAFAGYPSGKHNEKFPGGLCFSVNDYVVHGPAAILDYDVREGDIVTIDFGIKHKGLFTDHARTVIVGNGAAEDERLVRATYEALDAGIAAAVPGGHIGDIGEAVEAIAHKYKFGYPTILAGHGVGKSVHEMPLVPNFGSRGEGGVIREGLVIAIEPMFMHGKGAVYLDRDNFSYRTKDGSRAAHAEHTIIVTADGPEILTKE